MCDANQLLRGLIEALQKDYKSCADLHRSSHFELFFLTEFYGRTDLHEKFVSAHGCPTIHQWYTNENPVPRTFIYAAIKYLKIIRDSNRGLVARLRRVIFTANCARTKAPLANNGRAKQPVAVADAAMPCRLGVKWQYKAVIC